MVQVWQRIQNPAETSLDFVDKWISARIMRFRGLLESHEKPTENPQEAQKH
jgi:hypothetical protein